MNKQKLTYLSPVTETLVVRFEGVICQSQPNLALIYGLAGQNCDYASGSIDNLGNFED